MGDVGIGTELRGDLRRGECAITEYVGDAQFGEGGRRLGGARVIADVIEGDLGRHQGIGDLLEPSADGHQGQGDAAGRQVSWGLPPVLGS